MEPAEDRKPPVPEPVEVEEIKEKEVPSEALDYIPPQDAVFFVFPNGDLHRRIFAEPQEFLPEENEQIQEFEKYLKDNNLSLPETCTLRDAYKHIIVTQDFALAYDGLIKQYDTLKSIRPVSQSGIEHLLTSGMFYFCNRDKNFRPICILSLK